MAAFKFVISEPKTRKSYQLDVDQGKSEGIVGKKIGDEFDGDVIGLSGYTLKITGGTDKDGFPMHSSLKGRGKKKIILSGPPGFHPKRAGQRKRKMVCGDTISSDIVQVNVKVTNIKAGAKPLSGLMPKPKKEAAEAKPSEKPAEKPAEEKKVEAEKPAEKKEESGGGEVRGEKK